MGYHHTVWIKPIIIPPPYSHFFPTQKSVRLYCTWLTTVFRYIEIIQLKFNQLIKTFARITNKSATIIDHILCNTASKIFQSGVIPVGLSDHLYNILYTENCTSGVRSTNIKQSLRSPVQQDFHMECPMFSLWFSESQWKHAISHKKMSVVSGVRKLCIVIKIRSFKITASAASFVSELSNLNWTSILSLNNVNDAWKNLRTTSPHF